MSSPPHDTGLSTAAGPLAQTRTLDGTYTLSDRLDNLASKLEGMGMGQLPQGNVTSVLKALERPVKGGTKTLGFQRVAGTHPERNRLNSELVAKRTSVAPGHTGGHLGSHASTTNVHAPGGLKPRLSTASVTGRGTMTEEGGGGTGPSPVPGALTAITEAHNGASPDGSYGPPSARRRPGPPKGTSSAGVITAKLQPGSLGVPRDEAPREYNSYMDMTEEVRAKAAEALHRYNQVKVENIIAVRKIQSDKRDAFAALEKERKQTLIGGGARKRIHKQSNGLVGWSAERAAEAVKQKKDAARKRGEHKPPTQAPSLTFVEHRNRGGPKRPDSVDVAAQLILGDGGDKAFDEQDYDEEALHRAHDLIYAAEIDKKATGGVVAA